MKSTKDPTAPSTAQDRRVCAGCGLEKSEWASEGYELASKQYCCQGCAEGTGCTCKEPGIRHQATA